jgi:hypothetical protein
MRLHLTTLVMLTVGLAGCEPGIFGPAPPVSDAGTAPGASILPRPLATAAEGMLVDGGSRRNGRGADAGPHVRDAAPPPPKPLTANEVLPPDTSRLREQSGVALTSFWRWKQVPTPPQVPQAVAETIEPMRRLARGQWRVRLTAAGRMRASFVSRSLPLPPQSALLAREDRYGSIVLWPDERRYRVLPPGTLRAMLGERRADINPMSPGKHEALGEGERLGFKTRKVKLTSSFGTLQLELAPMLEAGRGGPLLCRLLVEIAGIDPSTKQCGAPEVVLAADYSWNDGEPAEGGGIRFEVTAVSRQSDFPSRELAVPPAAARQTPSGLPSVRGGRFFAEAELAAFRSERAAPPNPPAPNAPETGLNASNQSDLLLYLLLDGVPVAALEPWGETAIRGPLDGRYSVQWRTFLGEVIGEASEQDLPATVIYGGVATADQPDGG